MKPTDMWVYTFFPSEAGVFVSFSKFIFSLTSTVWMVGGGKVREPHVPLLHAHGAEMLLHPMCCVETTCKMGSGCLRAARHAAEWLASGGGWTLLGGSKASASGGCQTRPECLCQGMVREEQGTASRGCFSACRHGVGFASHILGPFLH